MLLSYYDTYYSDEFIPEHFESSATKIESSDFDSSTIFYQSPDLNNTASTMKSPQQLIENEIRDILLQYNNLLGVFTTERLLDVFLRKQVVNQIGNPNSFLGKLFEIAIDNDIILFSKPLDTYRNLEPIQHLSSLQLVINLDYLLINYFCFNGRILIC